MAKLSGAARKALPTKSFAEPDKRKYPIENEAQARTLCHVFRNLGRLRRKRRLGPR